MKLQRLWSWAFAAVVLFTPSTQADNLRIVAIVNENAITALDLKVGMCLALFASRLEDTPESRQLMGPVALQALIDGWIALQDAARNGITIPAAAIDERLDQLATDHAMSRQQLGEVLPEKGVPATALRESIRMELASRNLPEDARQRSYIDIRSSIDYAGLGACSSTP